MEQPLDDIEVLLAQSIQQTTVAVQEVKRLRKELADMKKADWRTDDE